jgi:hypothetical protein
MLGQFAKKNEGLDFEKLSLFFAFLGVLPQHYLIGSGAAFRRVR